MSTEEVFPLPKTKSAKKALRQAEKRRLRNRRIKSTVRTLIRKAERLIAEKQLEAATAAVIQAQSAIGKAAEKDVIHKNRAARWTSRLMSKLAALKKEMAAQAQAAS